MPIQINSVHAIFRIFLSAAVAFCFYGLWAYFANSLVTQDSNVLIKASLVQAIYSGSITMLFTFMLEISHHYFQDKRICLPILIPVLMRPKLFTQKCTTTETFKRILSIAKARFNGNHIPGMMLAPLPALVVQTILVISINVLFNTPNLWVTVAPSILFSTIYGYTYTIKLSNQTLLNVTKE